MAQYLISFDDGAMDHIPGEEMPDVGKAAHAVVQEAVNAGVWVFGTGVERAAHSRPNANGCFQCSGINVADGVRAGTLTG